MAEMSAIYQALSSIGEDPAQMLSPDNAFVVAQGHHVLGQQSVPGLRMDVKTDADGIKASVTVEKNRHIEHPVHLCFALFERFGVQNVHIDLIMEENAAATFWSHCLFTVPDVARHAMTAQVSIRDGADLTYQEVHYHGLSGGIEVIPRADVQLAKGARYRADFSLIQGRVGKLDIDYVIDVGEEAVAELTSKVYGHITDEIRIREQVNLNGARARGLVKSRVAVEDEARAEIIGITEGNAAGARGHVDCLEVVRGEAVASASPVVRVTHPEAKVTHEAAIGSVDHKQLETLMARGLDPEEAVDVIVRGMLS